MRHFSTHSGVHVTVAINKDLSNFLVLNRFEIIGGSFCFSVSAVAVCGPVPSLLKAALPLPKAAYFLSPIS